MNTHNEKLTSLEFHLLQACTDLASTHGRLLAQARTVAERMSVFADRLEAEGPARNVNGLGELQSYAADLDRLCAILAEKQRYVQTLEGLAANGQKEQR
jgi:hypothetical protein